jgi:glycosyltransferase involved in cell wall biosynthesis
VNGQKGKPSISIVFDQLPNKADGGLIATYISFVREMRDDLDISFVCVFGNENDIEEFDDIPIRTLCGANIDIRFYRVFDYLRKKQVRACLKALWSGLLYFACIPIGRCKTRRILRDQATIACAPAAGMFISRKVDYLLEVHTTFEYFWGDNALGSIQPKLMTKPVLTLFRSKAEARKGSRLFASHYIYNACEPVPRQEPGERRRGHRALYMGRIVEQKDPLRLLDCAQLVRAQLDDFTLDIYGSGYLHDEVAREIERRGIGDFVRLMGHCSDKSVYNDYGLLWLTSREEGFGLVIIEAASCGLPCVSTNWGNAACEVIEDGETGFIVDTDEQFAQRSIELLTDEGEWKRLAGNARANYRRKFTPEANRKAWLKILADTFPRSFDRQETPRAPVSSEARR